MPLLKNYVVINQTMVESFARQLGLPIDQEQTTEGNLGVSIKAGSAGFKSSSKRSALPPDDPRLLPPIVEALRESGQLRAYRPDKYSDFAISDPTEWYVYENAVVATPILVPIRENVEDAEYLPKYLTVWVLDPAEPTRQPEGYWDWLGAYVFLVQELEELKAPKLGYSGISALRYVVEAVATEGLEPLRWSDLAETDDKFGRWHEGHPIEKLKSIGGRPSRSRRIETIYKIAYMTNEQSITVDGVNTRINDILAYPLYIAD